MKKKIKKLFLQKKKRYLKKIVGTTKVPRLSVFRSHKHIYAQLIDDEKQSTLVFSSTLNPDILKNVKSTATQEAAFIVGENLAKKAIEQNIYKVVFDRGNKPYHGRIKNIAEGSRKQGLIF